MGVFIGSIPPERVHRSLETEENPRVLELRVLGVFGLSGSLLLNLLGCEGFFLASEGFKR